MNALDSPVEALAINYVRFGLIAVVNNLWAFVTAVTAALSFWRIRTGVSTVRTVPELPAPPPPPEDESPSMRTGVTEGLEVPSVAASASCFPPSAAVSGGGVTEGRLTLYFEGDGEDGGCEEVEKEEEEVAAVGGGCGGGEWWAGWERALRVKSGEMGWYRFQDLSALDGCVVRLWDDSRFRRLGREQWL